MDVSLVNITIPPLVRHLYQVAITSKVSKYGDGAARERLELVERLLNALREELKYMESVGIDQSNDANKLEVTEYLVKMREMEHNLNRVRFELVHIQSLPCDPKIASDSRIRDRIIQLGGKLWQARDRMLQLQDTHATLMPAHDTGAHHPGPLDRTRRSLDLQMDEPWIINLMLMQWARFPSLGNNKLNELWNVLRGLPPFMSGNRPPVGLGAAIQILDQVESILSESESILSESLDSEISPAIHGLVDDATLNAPKLVVTEETTIHDVVAYYEKNNLTNYTELLRAANIATASPIPAISLADVYKIELPDQQCVAVKCVRHETPYKRLKRATRELACWSFPWHQNILSALGFAVVNGSLAMVSPWMKNGCITDYITKNPSVDRLDLCIQLIGAIDYLHKHDMVHGDIKSPNVLISDNGEVKIIDFGVSIKDHKWIEFSVSQGTHGTYRWMAPEILFGTTDSTKEGDMYALGMTLTEIYTGERPYGSMDLSFEMFLLVKSGELRPDRPNGLPPAGEGGNELWKLMKQCWTTEPKERLTSSQAFERIHNIRYNVL